MFNPWHHLYLTYRNIDRINMYHHSHYDLHNLISILGNEGEFFFIFLFYYPVHIDNTFNFLTSLLLTWPHFFLFSIKIHTYFHSFVTDTQCSWNLKDGTRTETKILFWNEVIYQRDNVIIVFNTRNRIIINS